MSDPVSQETCHAVSARVPGGVPRSLSGSVRVRIFSAILSRRKASPLEPPSVVAALRNGDRVSEDRNLAASTTVYVCVTCRAEGEPPLPLEGRAGRRLLDALGAELGTDLSFGLVPVECLSVCKRPCTVSFAAPGKWTYVYGDLLPETAVPVLIEAARLYAATPDGLIPWKQRPLAIRTGVVARVPPAPQSNPEGQAA